MALLSSKFDITSIDVSTAPGALGVVLKVASPPSPSIDELGIPVAGTIPAGSIIVMDGVGEAVLGTAPDVTTTEKVLALVTIDGNIDRSGAFVQKLTCISGGFTMVTDRYEAGTYTPGKPVTFNAGKITPKVNFADTRQILGYVGPKGLISGKGVEVIVPQSVGA